jgi:2'-5' RNA ligase
MTWFIALPVPPLPWLDDVLADRPPGARQVQSADLHVTVAFLGACSRGAAARAFSTPTPEGPFSVELARLQPFGNRARPNTWGLVPADPEPLRGFISTHRNAMTDAARAPRDRHQTPRPHISVLHTTRSVTEPQRKALRAWARTHSDLAQPVVLDRIALYRSSEGPSRYEIVEQRLLG